MPMLLLTLFWIIGMTVLVVWLVVAILRGLDLWR